MVLGEKDSKETWRAQVSQHGDPQNQLEQTKDNAESDSAIVADGEDRTSLFVWLLVACSSISGLLFGTFIS